MSNTPPDVEVLVIGGGAAGLGGALTLARARRSVLVVDAGAPRNAPAAHVHNYLGREGVPPSELLAIGRAEVAQYGGEVVTGTATRVERLPGDGDEHGPFRVTYAVPDGGEVVVTAARLLVTTGLTDELPPITGLAERWGRDLLHCPYCHGWEARDQAIGIVGSTPMAVHQALLWRQWSEDVVLFRHTMPAPSDEEAEQLEARGIRVEDGEVTGLVVDGVDGDSGDDRLRGVTLDGDRVVPRDALVTTTRLRAQAGFLADLGLVPAEVERGGHAVGTALAADATGATAVPGVWAAGNVTDPFAQVMAAAASGVTAGAMVNADLVAEEARRAVVTRRAFARFAAAADAEAAGPAEFWDARYAAGGPVWRGTPNDALVREVAGLAPGTALDLGCGEGGDAVWLAAQGWRVVAVDVSAVALERGAAQAAEAGVGDRVAWQRHDLTATFPEGTFDLVTSHFLHSPGLDRDAVLRRAAGAVAPGGMLLVVGHLDHPQADAHHHDLRAQLPTPDELLAALDLPADEWEVVHRDEHPRTQHIPGGDTITRTDTTVLLHRAG